ncbi:LysM peptidoglycan-binding domain-containing protein [Jeotgalibacillus salarius]|uniref:LysM peptidoglycan-binding domain-containing protein n=1 Tax=Jeotgalibacillus salarius TaxID=546023 RepID=UPI00141AF32B|nr:LysM peptidoglycan-binding domain-containing protein [Jeotgalibacillus salarius]
MRKWLYTAAATVAVATFGGFDSEAHASTHKVSSGDSLWKIANKYQTSVDHIKKLNNLSSEIIRPNQMLKVSGEPVSLSAANASSKNSTSAGSQAAVYIVQPGDTLSAIARKSNMTLTDLTSINQLTSHIIRPGQSLKLKGSAQSNSHSNAPSTIVSNAGVYTVQPGDNLSKIAVKHGLSLSKLMEMNRLSGHVIYAGQKLTVNGQMITKQPNPPASQSAASAKVHIVKSGDTLSKIAMMHQMSLVELKRTNQLSSDLIRVGQSLQLKGTVQSTQPSTGPSQITHNQTETAGNIDALLLEAQSHLGTPYAWGGSTPGGFDCSGFIHYVYQKAGFSTARTNAEGQHARSFEVSNLQPGDLVFFENTYKKGISHVGIYIGGNQFIHAGDNGVVISSLSNSYWQSKFESFKRFY